MPSACCVPQCDSRTDGHRFPTSEEIAKKWRVAIRRMDPNTRKLWKPSRYSVVCRLHFVESDYKHTDSGKKTHLRRSAVPSVFPFNQPVNRRRPPRDRQDSSVADISDIGNEVTVPVSHTIPSEDVSPSEDTPVDAPIDVGVQCTLLNDSVCRLSIYHYQHNDKAVSYYTGFEDFNHFMYFFQCLGPAARKLSYQCHSLPHEDQLFLTLLKLRQAKDDFDLSIQFMISESTVSRLFVTWINFMYFQLNDLNLWASSDTVAQTMPENFKARFPSTRVILDATETPICKPGNVDDQRATFSSYKNKNTLKTMIGCSPRGLVTYVSDSYGGSTSDRKIIERSDLCKPGVFSRGDSIMADRGIMVQDIFSSKDVKVNTPTMLKGRSQLEPEEVVHDRRVASKRIHVERVIGLGKTYKILKKELHPSKVPLGSRIINICYMLSNFRSSIVNRLA